MNFDQKLYLIRAPIKHHDKINQNLAVEIGTAPIQKTFKQRRGRRLDSLHTSRTPFRCRSLTLAGQHRFLRRTAKNPAEKWRLDLYWEPFLMKPNTLLPLAEKLSEKSTMRYKLSAIIFKKNRIINTGYNRWLTIGHKTKIYSATSIHAEADAIIGCSRQELWGSSILIYRKNSGLAKPCKHCTDLIITSGIRTIYYTNGKNNIEKMIVS